MRQYLLGLIFFLTILETTAQVLDDSTKQIYSNASVAYFYEQDVLRNVNREFHPDSTLTDYQLPFPIRKSGWIYQDLGNTGTASTPLFFLKNDEIGQNMGMRSNLLYAPKVSDFKYYNTRSPYTYLGFQQGGAATLFNVTHSQNINPRLNLTLNIFKFNSNKQFGYTTSEEVLVNHWQYNLGTNYISKSKKYRLLATFYHFNNKAYEQGGILNGDTTKVSQIEKNYSRNYDAALTDDVINSERWNNFHLYQQFVLKNALQVFHVLDVDRKFYSFYDDHFSSAKNLASYGITADSTALLSLPDTLQYHYRFHSISNKFGFKGIYKGINYQAYARSRFFKLDNKSFESYAQSWKSETYLGGLLGYVFKGSTNYLDAKIEISPEAPNENYLIDATLYYKGFEIGFYNSAIPAGLFYKKFNNGIINFTENENFKSENSRSFSVRFPLRYKNFWIVPEANWSNISKYTYLEEKNDSLKTFQTSSAVNLLNIGFNAGYKLKWLSVNAKYTYNSSDNETAYPLPEHMINGNLDFNFEYAKVLKINTGIDFYYKSEYKGLRYSPLLNNFYASQKQSQELGGIPVLDLYLKFPISKGRFSITWANFGRNFGKKGWYTSPSYLIQTNGLIFKIDWPLFD